jgi:phage terminase large subunit-like protein
VFKSSNFLHCESVAYPLARAFNIISVDANFKNAEDASDIALVRLGSALPKIRVYAARSERGGLIEAIAMIKQEIKEGGRPSAILIEDKANGSAIIELLRKKIGNVVAILPKESKDARAHATNVYYEGRAIEHCNDMRGMGREAFEKMLEAYPGGLKRDIIDALAQGVMYCVSKDQAAWKKAVNIWDAHDRMVGGSLDFDDLFSVG